MSNKVKDIDFENVEDITFSMIGSIKKVDANNIRIDEKSYRNILIYYIEKVTIKDSK